MFGALAALPDEPSAPAPSPATATSPPKKHFFVAAGEVALLQLIPWTYARYLQDEEWARISTDTVRENFRTGFEYDSDTFVGNQFGHPYHGSAYFNAARSNGYDFWESSLFTLAGSLVWECCMENTAPSTNDLVNTTMGGMTRGEIAHRISAVIIDNTATGGERFWRELGATLLNPVGAFNRLVRGDMSRQFPNPEDRLPQGFAAYGDFGYRHVDGGAESLDQAMLSMGARYGDPFAGDIDTPFDTFWAEIDLNTPGGATISRVEERGVLKGWDWSDPGASSRHIFGFTQEYVYINNESQVFGAEMIGMTMLSRYGSQEGVSATTDITTLAIPLAGIQTTDFVDPETGRNYDYAPGAGLRVGGRMFNAGGFEIGSLGYSVVRATTVNGASDHNTLQFFRATVRIPFSEHFGAGAGYRWYSRKTAYVGFDEPRQTQSEWRAFMNVTFGSSARPKPAT
jgi:hypothetical protein